MAWRASAIGHVGRCICPHQTPAQVEAVLLEMRRAHAYWGARRIAFELARKGVEPVPSESAVYRCLVRAAVIDPMTRRRRSQRWRNYQHPQANYFGRNSLMSFTCAATLGKSQFRAKYR